MDGSTKLPIISDTFPTERQPVPIPAKIIIFPCKVVYSNVARTKRGKTRASKWNPFAAFAYLYTTPWFAQFTWRQSATIELLSG